MLIASVDFTTWPTGNRRLRSGLLLLGWWLGLYGLDQVPLAVTWGFTAIFVAYILRVISAQPDPIPVPLPLNADLPTLSILVPCRNEALVVANLVKNLQQLTYPPERLELWVADDRSSDGTGEILSHLQKHYPFLHSYSRPLEAKAGKSAVLNELLARASGEMIAVFDADAQVDPDFLLRTLAYFRDPHVGALQVRRVVVNRETNFLTRGQAVEMALDAYYQQQRIQIGGTGELRGNGQVLRRDALIQCGGWNEETITDDLDLTLRLHLNQWQIAFAPYAPVYEEGVTTITALWRQRQRWAEGGFQRYLDYGSLLLANRLGTAKSWDQAIFFFVSQYLVPLGLLPDLYWSLTLGQFPRLGLILNAVTLTAAWGLVVGQQRYQKASLKLALWSMGLGSLYLLHWLPVMIYTLLRMALLPKKLTWVKTARVVN